MASRRYMFAVLNLSWRKKSRPDGVERLFSVTPWLSTAQRSRAARRNTWVTGSAKYCSGARSSPSHTPRPACRPPASGCSPACRASLFSRGRCNRRAVLVKPAQHAITLLQHFANMTNGVLRQNFIRGIKMRKAPARRISTNQLYPIEVRAIGKNCFRTNDCAVVVI